MKSGVGWGVNELLNDPIYITTHAQKPKPKYPDKPKLLQKGQYMY